MHLRLLAHYGPLRWWPAESPFEVAVGAVLTQNTAWGNAEKAIANLKAAGLLEPRKLRALPPEALAEHIRPSGAYTVKARRLGALLEWLGDDWEARLSGELEEVRRELLTVPGVGEETADAILLYAAGRPTFVVDAYTRRILERGGGPPTGAELRRLPAAVHGPSPPRRRAVQRVPRPARPAREGPLPQATPLCGLSVAGGVRDGEGSEG